MGNRQPSSKPQPPPAALSAAVLGDVAKFEAAWKDEASRVKTDSQANNVLHALFSSPPPRDECDDIDTDAAQSPRALILTTIHTTLSRHQLWKLYHAPNTLGCTPLWILVAYGNVPLWQEVLRKLVELNNDMDNDTNAFDLSEMVLVPNQQGDTSLLATCSKGNVTMVQKLSEILTTTAQPSAKFNDLLQTPNSKGTTPLQIAIGNGHVEMSQYLLQALRNGGVSEEYLFSANAAGLSMFHICCERNFVKGLEALLSEALLSDHILGGALNRVLLLKDKNQANCLHVACYCGNAEVVEVWIDALTEAFSTKQAKSRDKSSGKNIVASRPRENNIVEWLELPDGDGRTAYWLAKLQGKTAIGEILARAGVDARREETNMLKEIQEADIKRQESAAKRLANQQSNPMIDGSALSVKQ